MSSGGILIIGGKGNMGKRYQAILNRLGKKVTLVDKEHNRHFVRAEAEKSDGVIIATPTDTHLDYIRLCADLKKPLLCEKPLSKDVSALREVLQECKTLKTPLSMVYQYKLLTEGAPGGPSLYDYFKHGNDGLVWDCIQIIGLARRKVRLAEESPVWICEINGKKLNIGRMDLAYYYFIHDWLYRKGDDLSEILEVHQKTEEMERQAKYG